LTLAARLEPFQRLWRYYQAGLVNTLFGYLLYAALVRLEEEGLVEPLTPVDRRRPYRLTAVGVSMLTEQLRGLTEFAQLGLRKLHELER